MIDGEPAEALESEGNGSTVIVVAADLGAVADARSHLGEVAASWHLTDLPTLELVSSELIANAIVHAGSRPVVRLANLGDGCVRIEVADEAPERPVRIVPYEQHTRGLGLHIVDALCESWGVTEPGPSSKVVWATMRLEGDDAPPDGC